MEKFGKENAGECFYTHKKKTFDSFIIDIIIIINIFYIIIIIIIIV